MYTAYMLGRNKGILYLYCIVLYCIVLCCVVLCCVVLCCVVLCCVVLCCVVLCCVVLYCIGTERHGLLPSQEPYLLRDRKTDLSDR